MIIRSFSDKDIDIAEGSSSLEKYGIISASRRIFIFITQEQKTLNKWINAKMCIINHCVYDNKSAIAHMFKMAGSHFVRRAVYFGNLWTNEPGNFQSHDAFFTIDCASTKEHQVIPGGNTVRFDPQLFTTEELNLCEDYDAIWSGFLTDGETQNILPQFYTESHMLGIMGDWANLVSSEYQSDLIAKMRDLIDNNTVIEFMDITRFDTMRLQMGGKLDTFETTYSESFYMPMRMGSAFDSYVGTGDIFCYDSNGRGIGKPGCKISSTGHVPMGTFFNKNYLIDCISNTFDCFKNDCEDIEKNYGAIRVLYNPCIIGDRYQIRFMDQKDSPIVPLSSLDEVTGMVKLQRGQDGLPKVSSIDTGFVTAKTVGERLNFAKEAEYDLFQKQMAGY